MRELEGINENGRGSYLDDDDDDEKCSGSGLDSRRSRMREDD